MWIKKDIEERARVCVCVITDGQTDTADRQTERQTDWQRQQRSKRSLRTRKDKRVEM